MTTTTFVCVCMLGISHVICQKILSFGISSIRRYILVRRRLDYTNKTH